MMPKTIGNLIKQHRKQKGLSQFELEMDIDASPGSISRLENGLVNPTKETLFKIAIALHLSDHEKADLFGINAFNQGNKNFPYSQIFSQIEYADKWQSGDLEFLQKKFEKNFDNLCIRDLLGFATVYLELGFTNNLSNLLDKIATQSQNTPIYQKIIPYLRLIEAELHIINDEFDIAVSKIDQVLALPKVAHNSLLLGKSHYLLALINSQHKDVSLGLKNITKAIEFFDIFNSPVELGKSYLYMTDFLEFAENYELASQYYTQAEEIFNGLQNNYLLGWCKGGQAFNSYLKGQIENSIEISKQAMKIDKHSGSKKQLFYSTSVYAKALTIKGDFKQAYNAYTESFRLEKNFRRQLPTSTNNLYLLFIKTKSQPSYIDELARIIARNRNEDPTKQYLLYSAMYLFGRNQSTINNGKANLLKLREGSKYLQFKKAIDSTLNQRQIQPIAV